MGCRIASVSLALFACLLLHPASAWKFLADFKVPSMKDLSQSRDASAKFGNKKLCVVTGTSSGLGRATTRALLRTGQYHVVGAVRDLDKMEAVAEIEGFDPSCFTPMHVELNSFDSVRKFCDELNEFKAGRPIDRLICNAGIYQPSLPYPKWSVDGHEQQMQVNYLSHFLMTSLLLDEIARAPEPRVIMVGSVTGNDNTVGGGGVYPIADLKDLEGFKAGFKDPISMADGYNFIGAKAYKDSKLSLMMLSNCLHDRYHRQTNIAFSAIYPGCIAESPLFREKREWFRKLFPAFMKYITGGFVSEQEAGTRLFQVAHDPRCSKSGVYWSWNGGPREGRGEAALERDGQILGGGGGGGGWDSIYENDQSDKVLDREKSANLFKYSTEITGAAWPAPHQPKSPCPTLKVVGAVTEFMHAKEELKRMKPMPGTVGAGATLAGATTKAADVVVGSTIGSLVSKLQDKLLGPLPETALTGSFEADARAARKEEEGTRKGFGRRLFSRLRNRRQNRRRANAAAEAAASTTLAPDAQPVVTTVDTPEPAAVQDDELSAAELEAMEQRILGVITGETPADGVEVVPDSPAIHEESRNGQRAPEAESEAAQPAA